MSGAGGMNLPLLSLFRAFFPLVGDKFTAIWRSLRPTFAKHVDY
jgi:hypothetical protein